MTTPSRTIVARCFGVLSVLGCFAAADAQVYYSARQIGGAGTVGNGVNDRGQVVGVNAAGQAFVTGANGVGVTVLPQSAGQSDQPIAINNRGQVLVMQNVGAGAPARGYITGPNAKGKYALSPLPGGNFVHPGGINSSGQVFGTSGYSSVSANDQTPNFQSVFITGSNGSGIASLAFPPEFEFVGAAGINDNGQIAGTYTSQAIGLPVPFITDPNGANAREINSPAITGLGGYLAGEGINAHGQVIVNWFSGAFAGQQAFLTGPNGTGGGSYLGSTSCCFLTSASALNDRGQVVGTAGSDPAGSEVGFVALQGTMQDLNTVIDPAHPLPSGTVLTGATAISNTGKIVASGSNTTTSGATTAYTWLLTPCAKAGACGGNIFWRNIDGHVITWFVSGGSVVSTGDLGNPGAQWSVAGSGDFTGTGDLDIVWTEKSGEVMIWYVTGGALQSSVSFGKVSTAGPRHRYEHQAGQHRPADARDCAAPLELTEDDGAQSEEYASWSVAGVADFNGDGKSDILWRNRSGALQLWFMNGKTHASSANIGKVVPTWTIEGVGDVNGDDIADIIWRSCGGDAQAWLMTGTSVGSIHDLGVAPTNWKLSGVADFDGDGKKDILWHDVANGQTLIWFLNGGAIASSAKVRTLPIGWSVAATGDFNGNGKHDILWRNLGGDTVLWDMNGITISNSANLKNMPTAQWSAVQ